MNYDIHTLENGLRIVLAPMQGTETATVVVMTGTGSRYESERENGLAHFLEHMFFKGTTKRPGALQISEELDSVGAIYNAFTAKDRTAYWAKVSSQYLPTALDVIFDISLHSTLPEAEIEKERGAIIQEIDMYEDIPMRTVDDVFEELLFGDHALGRTILGPKKNILSFTREEFTTYHERQYSAGNTIVCVAGAFDSYQVLEKITKEFGSLPKAAASNPLPFAGLQQSAPRVAIKEKKTDQTQLILGVPAYPYLHKDEFALAVLATVLGGGMSSRLFIEVREKRGLAYSVHAWAEKFTDTGYFAVQAGVEHAKLDKTIETILAEFKKIRETEVSPAELAKAKAYLKGTTTLSLETSDEIAQSAVSSLTLLGTVRTLEDRLIGIDGVTAADVQRVANDILKQEGLNLAVIGPHSDKAQLENTLKL